LIDAYLRVVNAVVLGKARALFADIERWRSLERMNERAFKNGNLVVSCEPRK
jgi:hypothetical protein